jgi:phenylalanyl-tRNA synthetase beta chain
LNLSDDSIKEIINVQEKLHQTLGRDRKKTAIGIYPLEKISFPIKYLAKEPKEILFKPLGSIDVMNGDEILNNHDTGIKYAHLLADKNKYPIFQDSKDNVLSMPPIINSELTGRVDEDTKAVFVECSGFDLSELSNLLNILCVMFSEIGAKIHPLKVKYPDNEYIFPHFDTKEKTVLRKNIFKLMGIELKDNECNLMLN